MLIGVFLWVIEIDLHELDRALPGTTIVERERDLVSPRRRGLVGIESDLEAFVLDHSALHDNARRKAADLVRADTRPQCVAEGRARALGEELDLVLARGQTAACTACRTRSDVTGSSRGEKARPRPGTRTSCCT